MTCLPEISWQTTSRLGYLRLYILPESLEWLRPIAVLPQSCYPLRFFLGKFQVSPSMPAVLLPRFSVTRRTAKALPLNEWVSRCCKAFTLPHLPASIAFTIRVWSRRTLALTFRQSIWFQSTSWWEDAPACSGWATALLCFSS